jgi:hypothetical protein
MLGVLNQLFRDIAIETGQAKLKRALREVLPYNRTVK